MTGKDGGGQKIDTTVPTPPSLRVELSRSDIKRLLNELDAAMTAAGLTGRVELVGGAALALVYYDRSGTTDIDGSVHPAQEILELADALAEPNGLKPGWLNNAAQGFFPPGETGEDPKVLIQGESLTVTVSGPKTLLAMKLRASRPYKDADDIAVLLRACGVSSLDEAIAVLEEIYDGEEELSERGKRLVIGALNQHTIVLGDGSPYVLEAVKA